MFPIEFGVACDRSESSWFEPIWRDAACLHLTLFTTHTYLGTIRGDPKSHNTALFHISKSLSILQQRLDCSNHEALVSDSTLLIVVGLTMAASALGDTETASKHLWGLFRMVELRGGLSSFGGKRLLQSKICR